MRKESPSLFSPPHKKAHAEPSAFKRKYLRWFYLITQVISVFCTFVGILFPIYDQHHPNERQPKNPLHYVWIFGIPVIAAIISGITANKFQANKILNAHPEDHDIQFSYNIGLWPEDLTSEDLSHVGERIIYAPRNRKSNFFEAAYLSFATTLLIVNNYFLLAAVKAAIHAFSHPKKHYSLLPLATTGLVILSIQSLINFVFNLTNAFYETAEQIKEDCTGSKEASLVSLICRPLTMPLIFSPVLTLIKTLGVFFHICSDYLGFILAFPPIFWIHLHKRPAIFWPFIIGITALSIPLLFVNFIQTLYFEAKESEINLIQARREKSMFFNDEYQEYPPQQKRKHFLRTLLNWKFCFKQWIRRGFITQGPFQAAGDMLPVILFMRDFFDRFELSNNITIGAIVPLATFVFIGSTLGTHTSEVKTALDYYDEEFADIADSRQGLNSGAKEKLTEYSALLSK